MKNQHTNRCRRGSCTGGCTAEVTDYVDSNGDTIFVPKYIIEDAVDNYLKQKCSCRDVKGVCWAREVDYCTCGCHQPHCYCLPAEEALFSLLTL